MYKFQAKWTMYGHYRVIVCDKVTIFIPYVCHGMGNNVVEAIFKIPFRNIIFHFWSAKNDYFCEASTKNMVQNDTHLIITKSSTYLMDNP